MTGKSKYLCPYCSTTFAMFEELKDHAIEQHKGEPVPAPEARSRTKLNGLLRRNDAAMDLEIRWKPCAPVRIAG